MSVPTAGQLRVVIVGATGMVGGYALNYALEHHTVKSATAIVRRKLGISHPKLNEVLHRDFANCSALSEALSGQDAAVFWREIMLDFKDSIQAALCPPSRILAKYSRRTHNVIDAYKWEWPMSAFRDAQSFGMKFRDSIYFA